MLITRRNDYALQAMVLLARQPARPLTAAQLASALKASPAFLSKIAQQLARAGLVRARRGKGGGLSLARPPQRILVGEVFRAVDGPLVLSPCLSRGRCPHLRCPLYPVLGRVQGEMERSLNAVRLSKFAGRPEP